MNSILNIDLNRKGNAEDYSAHTVPIVTSCVASNLSNKMTPEPVAGNAHAPGQAQGEATTLDDNTTSKFYLPQAWADFISQYPWDVFLTMSPKGCPHPETLLKLFDLMVHIMNREIFGQHYWKDKRKGIFWVRALEWQKRGAPHIHSLMGGIPDYVRLAEYYNFLYGKDCISKVEPYRKENGAEYYMTKSCYAFKGGDIDCSASMVLEANGKRICGKKLHSEYCARYTCLTKPDINHFVW
jgi:hypothetical protein